MNYSDISNRWKQFLAENTFKEDALFDKEKKKKHKEKKKERKDGKEIIVSEEDEVNEFEEFEENLDETSTVSGGGISFGAGNAFNIKAKKSKYKKLEEKDTVKTKEPTRSTNVSAPGQRLAVPAQQPATQKKSPKFDLTSTGGPEIGLNLKAPTSVADVGLGAKVKFDPKTGKPKLAQPSAALRSGDYSGQFTTDSFNLNKASSQGSPWTAGVGRDADKKWSANVGYEGEQVGAGVRGTYDPKQQRVSNVGADLRIGADGKPQFTAGLEGDPNNPNDIRYSAGLKFNF